MKLTLVLGHPQLRNSAFLASVPGNVHRVLIDGHHSHLVCNLGGKNRKLANLVHGWSEAVLGLRSNQWGRRMQRMSQNRGRMRHLRIRNINSKILKHWNFSKYIKIDSFLRPDFLAIKMVENSGLCKELNLKQFKF